MNGCGGVVFLFDIVFELCVNVGVSVVDMMYLYGLVCGYWFGLVMFLRVVL